MNCGLFKRVALFVLLMSVAEVTNAQNNHEYVDLGLPSGTLWATCNVGANAPEEYGDYFAWGETQPKDWYDWSTYLYCNNGDQCQLTKYCNNSNYGFNGFTDNLTTLLSDDDAATVNWGADWRMPTNEDWYELQQNTTHTWTTHNGVNGMRFIGSNGNSIFLPAADLRDGNSGNNNSNFGYYWSSSLHYKSYLAIRFFIQYNGVCNRVDEWRYRGLSVRAVRLRQNNALVTITCNPSEGGIVSGGGIYTEGSECTLTATPNTGYAFVNWTENDEVVSAEATYTFTVSGDRHLVANFNENTSNHDYVDLGLPSGTLWATCNVGANAPEEYGDYFAWGETQPKEAYNWSTYQYCNGNANTLTKYCNNSEYGYNGYSDDLNTLLPEDDAATANWGDGWRMPSMADWEELMINTNATWTTINGVRGVLFSASNGNHLFLPAAGYRYDSSLDAGSYGLYLSNSLYTYEPVKIWEFYFHYLNFYYLDSDARFYGQSVRAVRSSSQSNIPTGAVNGKFTINSNGDQVYFSQGNLQYIGSASTPYWKFADHQWDCFRSTTGQSNNNNSPTIDRDLFAWGTSGYDHGAVYYQPYNINGSNNCYYAYGNKRANLYDQTGKADWGYNAISNGGNAEHLWRTPTSGEWYYLFYSRQGSRFAFATVNDIPGVILLPDNWNIAIYTLNNINTVNDNITYGDNAISGEVWINVFETNGAVFLPAAGRSGGYNEIRGHYWASDFNRIEYNSTYANATHFSLSPYESRLITDYYSVLQCNYSVRLVCSAPAATVYSIEAEPNPAEGGTVVGPGTYEEGQICTLTATANEGFTFVNWTKDGTEVSTESEYSFVVTEDAALVAKFALLLTIPGYGTGSGSYRFIASPLVDNTAPATVEGMTDGAYDLYGFDQSEVLEWQNYKAHADDFMLVNGQGYLYANAEEVNLVFKGTFNEDVTKEVSLVYDSVKDCAGWNLVGNPFPTQAYVDRSYCVMNEGGTAIEPVALSSGTAIPACTGVMVKTENTGETVVFSRTPLSKTVNSKLLQISVVQEGDNAVYDKAIVSFNEDEELEKMVFNEGKVKLYIPKDGKDYAIAYAQKQGEIPLHFKAMENGNYTLEINLEGLEMGYLHLIDTKIGAEVDLLQTPSYTFEAQSSDDAVRFKLVFKP